MPLQAEMVRDTHPRNTFASMTEDKEKALRAVFKLIERNRLLDALKSVGEYRICQNADWRVDVQAPGKDDKGHLINLHIQKNGINRWSTVACVLTHSKYAQGATNEHRKNELKHVVILALNKSMRTHPAVTKDSEFKNFRIIGEFAS